MKPNFRCGTRKAIAELAEELNLPNDLSMQDWSYEVSNPDDIDKYIAHYDLATNEDKKFVLVEMILQAIVDQPGKERIIHYWEKIKPVLSKDFRIHEYTIAYWTNLNDTNFENCLILSPLLRQLAETKINQ